MLRKPFGKRQCADAWYSPDKKWLTNGHWMVRVGPYGAAKGFEPTSLRNITNAAAEQVATPSKPANLLPVTYTDIVHGDTTGLALCGSEVIGVDPEYWDMLDNSAVIWWSEGPGSPLYAALKPTRAVYLRAGDDPAKEEPQFVQDDVVAVLMPRMITYPGKLRAVLLALGAALEKVAA